MRKNAKSSYEYEKHYVYQRDTIQILFQVEIFSRACYISFRITFRFIIRMQYVKCLKFMKHIHS